MKKKYIYLIVIILVFVQLIFISGCGMKEDSLVITNLEEDEATMEIEVSSEGLKLDDTQNAVVNKGSSIKTIYVYVCGAVNNPGVYELDEHSRANDALKVAGGLLEEAAIGYVNLAKSLEDGEKLYFPTKLEVEGISNFDMIENDGLTNINTATVDELIKLPGIGETRALDIIAYRQSSGAFESLEDIMKVPGIKQSVYNKIKDYIKVK